MDHLHSVLSFPAYFEQQRHDTNPTDNHTRTHAPHNQRTMLSSKNGSIAPNKTKAPLLGTAARHPVCAVILAIL